jgi:2-polyprenyl-3-methyl-5-hydroxy-6-metoxy-1,4-benzoquinol methylase
MQTIETINREFYNSLYKRHRIIQLIYPFISYDQQSKSKENFKQVRSWLKQASRDAKKLKILDYGFGHGSFLMRIPTTHELFGCELSQKAVNNFPNVAGILGKTVTTFTPDQLDEIIEDRQFDLICLSHVLEHMQDDRELLQKLVSRLSMEGKVLVNLPINEVWDDPKHMRKYTADSVLHLFHECGLHVEHVRQTTRLISFLMIRERVRKPGVVEKLVLKGLRLFLAVMPQRLNELLDALLPQKYPHQNIIIVGRK